MRTVSCGAALRSSRLFVRLQSKQSSRRFGHSMAKVSPMVRTFSVKCRLVRFSQAVNALVSISSASTMKEVSPEKLNALDAIFCTCAPK